MNKGIFNAGKQKVPGTVSKVHRTLKGSQEQIAGEAHGAGSHMAGKGALRVGRFVRRASAGERKGALLYRLVKWHAPERVVELGTGLGVSAMYLHAGMDDPIVHTIEGNKARAQFASMLFKRNGIKGVQVHSGDMEETLRAVLARSAGRMLAYVDGNHRYAPTMQYVRMLMAADRGDGIILLDDIYWSKEMGRAWKELRALSGVGVSVDLYHTGILVLRKDLHPMALKIWF